MTPAPCAPACSAIKQRFCRHAFDLLAEAVHIDIHHGVVGVIGGAAQRVGHKNDAEAPAIAPSIVVSTQTSISPPVTMAVSTSEGRSCWRRPPPRGIDILVEGAQAGRIAQGPAQAHHSGRSGRSSSMPSAGNSAATCPALWPGFRAGMNRPFRMSHGYGDDVRQEA